jgi:hypothetical protein
MTDNIFSLYEPSAQIWSSIEMVNNAINRARFPDWFRVRLKFMAPPDECIGARTRIVTTSCSARRTACLPWFLELISAAQNIHSIHGLGAVISLAASKGGNWQIFEKSVKRSGA